MTSKAKAIEALQRIKSDHNFLRAKEYKRVRPERQKEMIDEFVKDYELLENVIAQPTLDDCIAVVEKMFEKENERLRKIIQSYYSKSWLVTLSKNILAYNIDFQMEILTALRGLKEGK